MNIDKKTFLEEQLLLRPSDPFLHFALAREYEKLNKKDKAMEKYQELMDRFPAYTGTYLHYTILLIDQSLMQRAFDVFNRGLDQCSKQGAQRDYRELKELESIFEQEE